jgi:hypothetical protein
MLRSLFLSSTSLLVVACGDDVCGPGNAPEFGLVAGNDQITLVFGNIMSGLNNDCPDPMAPSGVVSMTLQGTQQNGPGLLTLCIGRPDLLDKQQQPFGTAVRIIDLNGEVDGCTLAYESLRPVSGGASASGLCDNGANTSGFALAVDGNLSLKRTCPAMSDTIAVSFDGEAAIEHQGQ